MNRRQLLVHQNAFNMQRYLKFQFDGPLLGLFILNQKCKRLHYFNNAFQLKKVSLTESLLNFATDLNLLIQFLRLTLYNTNFKELIDEAGKH